ncbi:MAG: glycosyltransferase family 1 protein [Pseudomonadota bacterium]
MEQPLRHVGIGFGRLEQLHDGLGEFSMQLGSRLAARHKELRERHGIVLHFHLPPVRHGLFGPEVSYIASSRLHRYIHWDRREFALWHSLHQFAKYRPPMRTQCHLLTLHDLNYLYGPVHRRRARTHRKHLSLVKRVDALAAISQHTAEDVRQHLHWARPIEVIYNGCTDLSGLLGKRPPSLRFERFFFHLSRMAPSKNPESLLALAAYRPHWNFVLAGPRSNDTERIADAARSRSLQNVQVLESISVAEKAWLFEHCEAFVFPSITEGFGLPPIEAMHMGCAVFLSDRTSLPEIGGSVARYFRTFEPAEMATLIEAELPTLVTPEARARTRHHAASFDWDVCAQHYINLYLRLLALPANNATS